MNFDPLDCYRAQDIVQAAIGLRLETTLSGLDWTQSQLQKRARALGVWEMPRMTVGRRSVRESSSRLTAMDRRQPVLSALTIQLTKRVNVSGMLKRLEVAHEKRLTRWRRTRSQIRKFASRCIGHTPLLRMDRLLYLWSLLSAL